MRNINKKINSKTSSIIVICIFLLIGLGCKQLDSLTKGDEPPPKIPVDAGNTEQPDSNSPTPSDISGNYAATGTNVDGGGNYTADLVVAKRDDVYQFSWNSNGNKYEGVGVQTGNKVAVAFADGTDGSGCGVILYKINPEGTLNGKTGYWGANETESESASRTSGSALEGKYDVTGKNLQGENYEMKLTVTKQNEGYKFSWTGNRDWQGYGIKQGDTVSVGFGGAKCGFVAYEINDDGTLEGKWGGKSSTSFGTEKAVKK